MVLVGLLIAVIAIAGTWSVVTLAVPAVVAVDYDGEFDNFVDATEGAFISTFTVDTACNITDDDTVGENYLSCIWDTATTWTGASLNATAQYFSVMIPIEDGPVEDMTIEITPQTSGTCKPGTSGNVDVTMESLDLYLHEDGYPAGGAIRPLSGYIDDQDEVDAAKTGILAEGEYVLVTKFLIQKIWANCASGDDLYKYDLSLKTDGKADDGHILLQNL